MEDQNKTKKQLINELMDLRQRIAGLEALENEQERAKKALWKSEEAAQRLAQEKAIVAEIGRIISSTLNIDEVYERFAEEVHKLIPFDRISINTLNREDRIILMAYVFGVEVIDHKQGDVIPFTDPFCGEIITKRSGILIQTEDESELAKRYPILLSTFQAGLRSMMSVPLISKDEVIGILHLRSTKSNAYSEKDLRLAERVGNQIAGAVANAQLFVERKQAEEALRIEQAYLEQLFESAQESIAMTDNNGIVLRVNNEFTRLFGYARDEAIGKSIDDLVVSDDKVLFKEATSITKGLSKGKGISLETMRHRKDGTPINVSILASPIIIANEHVGTYGIYRDITERKRAEEALRKSEEINRTLFSISNAINTTRDLDELYGFIHTSLNQVIDLTNFYISIYDRKNQSLTFPYHVDEMDKAGLPDLTKEDIESSALTGRVLRTGSPLLINKEEMLRQLREQGKKIVGTMPEVWLGVPLKVKNEVIGVMATQSYTHPNLYSKRDLDILLSVSDQVALAIERKRAEEALRENEEKYRELFDDAPIGYHEIDLEGHLTRINRTELNMLGYIAEEMLGRPVWEFIQEHEASQKSVTARLAKGISSAHPFERTYLRKDGTLIPVLITEHPLKDANGRMIGIRATIQDITERKRAEYELKGAYMKLKETQAQLIQSEKMASIGQLAAGIAHEINNPAGFIISNLDILNKYIRRITPIFQRYVQLETSLAQYQIPKLSNLTQEIKDLKHNSEIDHILTDLPQIVSECLEGTHRIKKIVHDLRTFSHAEVAEPKDVIVNDLLDFSLNLVSNEITHKAEVVKEYTDVPKLFCYPHQLSQVFLNILMNAVQAIGKRGKIIIKTYEKDKNIFIEIIDTGCGIPEELQNRIFEPFFTTKEVGRGTGLGLSIVYGIIKKHKGDVTVKSKIGEGTNFIIRLPKGGLYKNEG